MREPSQETAQYTAIRFPQRLEDAGARPSMGSVGDSYDNALAENFFSSLKVERVYRTSYRTREEAELTWCAGSTAGTTRTASNVSLAG